MREASPGNFAGLLRTRSKEAWYFDNTGDRETFFNSLRLRLVGEVTEPGAAELITSKR
jgi:hypothetical protein